MAPTECALTVVIASIDAGGAIRPCIEAMVSATAGLEAEILVVDSSRDESASVAASLLGEAAVVRVSPGALAPDLWARGIAASRGRAVALTLAQCRVPAEWARALLDGLASSGAGAASPLDLPDDAAARDRAVFYLRYSAFLEHRGKHVTGVADIPADNAIYDGAAVREYVAAENAGFWEVDFHRRLPPRLGTLSLVPSAEAVYSGSPRLGSLVSQRFRHGMHSGAWQALVGRRSRWSIIVGSPVVPLLLAVRVGRRVAADARHRRLFAAAIGQFLVLAVAWAAGEAWGAMHGARRATPTAA